MGLQAAACEEVDTYPLDVLGFLPVIAPLARFLGLILAFFGAWMSTAIAHKFKGWHTFLLSVIYLATLIISITFLATVIEGTVFTVDGLLQQLGWHAG